MKMSLEMKYNLPSNPEVENNTTPPNPCPPPPTRTTFNIIWLLGQALEPSSTTDNCGRYF